MQRAIINSEVLIEEVKKRPMLYDYKASGNTSEMRRSHWEEVAKHIFNSTWENSNVSEKEALVKEVQVKWKSLRDSFMRVRKLENELDSNGHPKKRKKYIFYDRLSFLKNYPSKKQTSNMVFLDDDKEDSLNDIVFVNTDTNSNPLEDEPEYYEPNSTDIKVQDLGTSNHDISGGSGSGGDHRIGDILQELVSMQREDRNDDRMANKRFLLSLLPFMEKLPDDVNLEVRLQLMSVIQAYSSGRSLMKV